MGRKILADAGYDVFTVNNGSAALKRISEVKPDLIVLDVYMPGYSGLEVCQRLKDAAETGHIPVLLTVGKLEPFKPEEARRVRADAHIVKPFEASELLTAITRLEDRMVPMSDGSRFSNSVSGVERFAGDGGRKTESSDDADTGWKSRLRFPSKKKKEEPEPEPEEIVPEATFRNYRKGKGGKSGPGPAITVKPPAPPGQEPGLVPDIPRDITPDELDALSALAAKLDGPIPAAENIAPVAEKVGPVETPTPETPAPEIAKAPTEVEVPVAETPKEPAKQVEAPAAITEFAVTPVPSSTSSAEVQIQVQGPSASAIEVPTVEPPVQPVVAIAAPAVIEAIAETPVAVAVSAAAPQEAVPLERTDAPQVSAVAIEEPVAEPHVALTTEPVAEAKADTKPETEVIAPVVETPLTEVVAKSEPVAVAAQEEAKPEAKPEEDQKLEAVKDSAPTVEAAEAKSPEPESPKSEQETPRAEEPAPSEEELAEALRLLTPATGGADVTTIPSHGTLVAAGQLLAEEAARNAAAGPRWIAEAVALSPEEAALSLEDEMFRTFATTPAAVPGTTRGDEGQRTGITGVSAIAAAVENRLAEAEKVASVSAGAASSAASAAIDAAVSAHSEPLVAADKNQAEPAEESASATFADAISTNREAANANDKSETAAVEATTQAVESAGVATASAHAVVEAEGQDSSSDSGGDEAMAKDGKSTWRQIRTAPAGAGSNVDAVEAAKTEAANEAPKAMAAAAAADGSASGTASDAASIASIVDSVMADLRPKIVEEIAKKLAGK